MTLSDIRGESRFITRTDSSTFSDSDLNREINTAYGKLIMEILKVEGYRNSFGKHVTTNLISTDGLIPGNIGYNGEYPFPTDLLKPMRFELKYETDGMTAPATIIDMSQIETNLSQDSYTNLTAVPGSPVVRFFHDSFFIDPVRTDAGDITAGIHIWYEKRQSKLTLDAHEPLIEENFQDLIPLMVASRYYLRHPKKRNNQVLNELRDLMKDFRSYYRKRINIKKVLSTRVENFT